MFASANGLKAYTTVQNHVQGAEFEKRWFESVIMVLNRIQAGQYDPVTTHVRLIEVRDGLQWVQENLNERLNSQHRTLLKSIYSTNIRIINGVIETLNTDMLTIVIASVKTILKPYERKTEGAGAPA
ncbi:hypothetical protein BCM14_2678 [Jezberella montanilacus]|jgi:hypothetical protein|uniref:Uncharacterized protein n=1 Tax=Jezberella montanilacus TaxID=323426 RepID=A0A2T0XDB0_9BURK|nr:hypothetical protein [Jezberella montanilacus]PRY96919.1 hypothetical protein BCM14_2678 [Jezberella montanilacus]